MRYAKAQHRFSEHLEPLLKLHHLRGEMDPPSLVRIAYWGIRGHSGVIAILFGTGSMDAFLESTPLQRNAHFFLTSHGSGIPQIYSHIADSSSIQWPTKRPGKCQPTTAPRRKQFYTCFFQNSFMQCHCMKAMSHDSAVLAS